MGLLVRKILWKTLRLCISSLEASQGPKRQDRRCVGVSHENKAQMEDILRLEDIAGCFVVQMEDVLRVCL